MIVMECNACNYNIREFTGRILEKALHAHTHNIAHARTHVRPREHSMRTCHFKIPRTHVPWKGAREHRAHTVHAPCSCILVILINFQLV